MHFLICYQSVMFHHKLQPSWIIGGKSMNPKQGLPFPYMTDS